MRVDRFIHSAKSCFRSDPEKLTFSISSEHKTAYKSAESYSLPYSLPSLWKICKRISPLSPFDQATWQHPRESHRRVCGSARINGVRMALIMGARGVSIPDYGWWLSCLINGCRCLYLTVVLLTTVWRRQNVNIIPFSTFGSFKNTNTSQWVWIDAKTLLTSENLSFLTSYF